LLLEEEAVAAAATKEEEKEEEEEEEEEEVAAAALPCWVVGGGWEVRQTYVPGRREAWERREEVLLGGLVLRPLLLVWLPKQRKDNACTRKHQAHSITPSPLPPSPPCVRELTSCFEGRSSSM